MLKYLWKRELTSNQLAEFCMHIGALLGAGVPLVKTMEILQNGAENKRIQNLYNHLQMSMQKGNSFSTALEETGLFPELFVNMFRAAEADGRMEETAKRMAVYYKKEYRTKNKIRSAMIYPKVLGMVSVFVVLTVFLVVMPTVEPLFRGMELPILTRILLVFSHFIRDFWPLCFVGIIMLEIGKRVLIKKNHVRRWFDRLKLLFPIIGKQFRILYTARFAYTESNLYSSGLPLVEGLDIAARTIGNRFVEDQMKNVIDQIQGGESLSRAICLIDGFDAKLAPIIHVGEETGKLDEMLESIAESYEHEAETALNRLVSMIEPIMIIVMGLAVGIILLGIMVPMWSMYEYIM